MRKLFIMLILVFFIAYLTHKTNEGANFHSPVYSGNELKIGIVGDIPKIREKNVSFIQMSMEDVLQKKFANVDSVFITKKHLKEAAEPQYAKIYWESPIPFVFIDSEKVYLAFLDDQLSYEDAHIIKSGDYVVGFYKDTYFGIGLYNNIRNEKTIQDCYSRLFVIIERFKNTGKILIK
ncbi:MULTISPECIES: hypothetical protein [Anoxybacillus]|uniref:Uncharacterized protein n=1 Tax=Anoxybacillus ayderensis TaxID=265546 RepID=A0A0D0H1K3_9BACL|nr:MULTISPECIES: hypothetical protein [Anoxybacillus]KIP21881.1 hypothetical protein JV16_01081 [Anoxybacillus ayderensis]NNU97530.1 hypothetical protein [Anoxybacillus sp. EFIL]